MTDRLREIEDRAAKVGFEAALTEPLAPGETERDRLIAGLKLAARAITEGNDELRSRDSELARLRALVKEAGEALEPFAVMANNIPELAAGQGITVWNVEDPDYNIEIGTLTTDQVCTAAATAEKIKLEIGNV